MEQMAVLVLVQPVVMLELILEVVVVVQIGALLLVVTEVLEL